MAWLDVNDLRIVHRGCELVKGLSFQAHENEVLGILGESGSGKSLTCLSIMGLLPPGLSASGTVSVDGVSLAGAAGQALRGRRIAMVLQNPMSCFDSVFTIRSHFRETLRAHGRKGGDDDFLAALDEVNMAHDPAVLDLYPFQLSGGMLQRIMLALSLILGAPYLVADEPTTDLDLVNQARILDLLEGLATKRHVSMVLVTHDLGVLARLAQRIIVMRDGRIVDRGTIQEIFDRPGDTYTAELVRAHLELSGLGEELQS